MFRQTAIAVVLTTGIFVAAGALAAEKTPCPAAPRQPIKLHPDNPHYFLWRGKPTVLVTSGEHYGAVMNTAFDYVAYLDELQSVGLNLTRIFSGVYCEALGDFGIKDNTLAPGHGNLLCPFARSDTPGYANGGNKFDLTKWDGAYFKRLKDFVAQAGKRGIVVEFVLFCPYYADSQWNLSPFNVKNNVNDIGGVPRGEVCILKHPKLLDVQQALVRKIVTELKDADNLYYEICNEAYAGLFGAQDPWQHAIASTIVETEKDLACKHLIAQNTWPMYDAVHPAVSIFNFHPGAYNVSVESNYGLNKLTGLDETTPTGSPPGASMTAFDYRRWGWTLILAGGAIYNNLDYSFTVQHPKGAYRQWDQQPGGTMATMRKQLRILKDFMEGFDFIRMKPCQNGIALARSAADEEKSRILIQWNEQAWESLNFPIKPNGTQGDSWHGDGLVLAKKITGDEGKKTGAAAEQEGIDPATAAANVRNLIGQWDVVVNHSFKTVWTFHEDGTVESTAGGVRSARWKAAAKMTTPPSLRALAEPGKQYAIYLSGVTKPVVLEIDLSPGNYRAQWLHPRCGHTEPPLEFSHAGDVRRFESPACNEDIAISIRRRTPPKNAARTSEPREPIKLHPENPHYFLWRDKPTILIGSGEHYGAVLNRQFDYVKYLGTLQKDRLNHTRLFMGSYVEANARLKDSPQAGNTLDPAPGQLICPFARSNTPGYANGGNKFDLTKWDGAYFTRLKDFVGKAAQHGVVVEVNLFCPYYGENEWKLSPLNAANNVNNLGHCKRTDVFTMDHHDGLLAVQEAMVRRIVSELRDFDNIYYEICNEPYAGGPTMAWQRHIAEVIAAGEKEFPYWHLISQNVAVGFREDIHPSNNAKDPHPAVSIFNFHYAPWDPPVVIEYALKKPIGDNETGGKGIGDAPYRRQAWEFILVGGALFSHLDYSFTVGHEDGSFVLPHQQWGGGSPVLRRQLRILKDFMEGFDFIRMKPDTTVVKGGVPAGGAAYVLANSGEAYAVYLYGGKQAALMLSVPAGRYRAEWVNTLNGKVDKSEQVTHGGGVLTLGSPEYKEDVALRVVRVK